MVSLSLAPTANTPLSLATCLAICRTDSCAPCACRQLQSGPRYLSPERCAFELYSWTISYHCTAVTYIINTVSIHYEHDIHEKTKCYRGVTARTHPTAIKIISRTYRCKIICTDPTRPLLLQYLQKCLRFLLRPLDSIHSLPLNPLQLRHRSLPAFGCSTFNSRCQ